MAFDAFDEALLEDLMKFGDKAPSSVSVLGLHSAII
jgi:hypothetical protein